MPIKELVGKENFYVYSYDIKKNKLVLGKVKKVWCTGTKPVYKVDYEWRFSPDEKITDSIKVTSNHPFLLRPRSNKDPFNGINRNLVVDYLSIDDGLTVGHSLMPFCQTPIKEGYNFISTKGFKEKESRFLLEKKLHRKLKSKEQCHHKNENKSDDSYNNLQLLDIKKHSQHHGLHNNPMHRP